MRDKELLNIFEILDVQPNCTKNDIKKAYRRKAKIYHPDHQIDKEQKKEAEKKFKIIKKAYDYLMSLDDSYFSNSKQPFEETDTFKILFGLNESSDDDYEEFIISQQSHKKKEKSFEELESIAINFIESEIKKNKLNMLYVYECIRKNKMILAWNIKDNDEQKINDYLIKEALYRRKIKNTDLYKGFIKNYNFYKNIDLHVTIKINKNNKKQKFNQEITYDIKSICEKCCGVGCDYCHNGIVLKQEKLRINIPLTNTTKFYEFEKAGCQSPLTNGKLILTVKRDDLKHDIAYTIKVKNHIETKLNPLLDLFDMVKNQLVLFWNLMKNNKHYTTLYSVIIVLIITIICLAVLL